MNGRIVIVGILAMLLLSSIVAGFSEGASNEKWMKNSAKGVRGYTPHDAIRINSNADFTYANGVMGGSGTKDDPYIISGWDIDAHRAKTPVYIGNTTAYFVIENCLIHNSSFGQGLGIYGGGVVLYNVENGTIRNNTIYGNLIVGVRLWGQTNNVIVENNTVYDNYAISGVTNEYMGSGIFLQESFDNLIANNTVYGNGEAGIKLEYSYRNTVMNNRVYSNYWCGIYLRWDAHHNTIKNNVVYDNVEGIYLNSSGIGDVIKHNEFYNNSDYGIHLHTTSDTSTPTKENIIVDNLIYNSPYGVYIGSSNGNRISNNTIHNISGYGIYIYKGLNNLIYANIVYYNHGSGDSYDPAHVQAYDRGTNNLWSSSSGIGNYWLDWANNNNTNDVNPQDGIVDWPYLIDGPANAIDHYPLKNKSLAYVLTPPRNLTAVSGYSHINLTWDTPPSGSAILTGYRIYRDGSPIAVVSANEMWYVDTNVSVGRKYLYYVTSLSSTGESLKSNEVEIVVGGAESGVIRINNNDEFAQMAQQKGWPGNGSKGNPYIISGYNIDAHGAGDAIYIGNTTAYFIVEHCYLHNTSYHSIPYFDGSGITIYNATNGIIEYNTMSNNKMNGIHLRLAFNNTVFGNNISNNGDAIYLYSSQNNTISENNISNNRWYGIVSWESAGSIVEYNNISGGYALYFFLSSNDTINGNKMVGGGIVLYGPKNTFTTQNITANNTVNGKPVYYYKNANMNNATVPLDAGEVILGNVSWLKIENLNLSNGDVGIELGYSDHITVSGNNIWNNGWDGIYVTSSNNCVISNNTLVNSSGLDGIELQSSYNNTISRNDISRNGWYGVELLSCSGNTIVGNNITHNQNGGIFLDTAFNNTIKDNNITYTDWNGIDMESSSYNTITGNDISNNFDYYGINIDSKSHNNLIYYNSFRNDWIYAHDAGSNNSWNTTTGIGNYWYLWANSNNTNDQNHDGIVDWPYKIDGSAGAKDYYPLRCPIGRSAPTQPYNLSAVVGDGYVNLTWNAPVCNGSSPITEYRIYRNGALVGVVPGGQLWYNDTNVSNGHTYTYYVTAVNSVGESSKSNEIHATPEGAVPELQVFWGPIIVLLIFAGVLQRRNKGT